MRKRPMLIGAFLAALAAPSVAATDFTDQASTLRALMRYDGPPTAAGLTQTSLDIRPDCTFAQDAEGEMQGVQARVVMSGDLRSVAPRHISLETHSEAVAIRFDLTPPAPNWQATTRIAAGNALYDQLVSDPETFGPLMPATCTTQGCEMTRLVRDDEDQPFFRLLVTDIMTASEAKQATDAFRNLAALCQGTSQ